MDDRQLLRQYSDHNSQEAFAALTERYLSLVYSVCRRELADDETAEDVTQAVFLILARKASTLRHGVVLSGWLFQTARFAAKNARIQAQRRASYEQKAAAQMDQKSGREAAAWAEIEPVLNQSLAALRDGERECVLLRFFQGQSFAEAGAALGLSEEAARKRVTRALEKMRRFFIKEGIIVPAVALAALLSAHAAKAAPAPVAAAVAHLKIGTTPVPISLLAKGTLNAMRIVKLKAAVGLAALMMLGGFAYTVATIARTATAKPAQQRREKVAQLNALVPHTNEALPPLLMKTIYADDAALKTAHIAYMEFGEQHIPIIHASGQSHPVHLQDLRWRSKVDTSSASDGRFNIKTVTDQLGQPVQEHEQVYNGVDKMTVFHGGREVRFEAYVPQDVTTDRLISVAPGPCFAIGRGLSLLGEPHLSGPPSSPVLTGNYGGDTYRATLDPRHRYLATQIARFNGGVLVSRWMLEKPFRIPGGTWIATSSTYEVPGIPGNGDHSTFLVLPSESWKASASSFDYEWQVPGKEIVDLRLNKPAVFDSRLLIAESGGRPLTSASLLEFTRQSLASQAKKALENEGLARQHNTGQAVRPSMVKALLGVLAVTAVLLLCRRLDQFKRGSG